jgi:phage terminase small subunit
MGKLANAKQETFAQEYLIDLNATKAAIRAGYAERSARQQGQRLLTNDDIAERIAELQEKREKRTEITADRVLQELAAIGFSDIGDFATWGAGGVMLKESSELREGATRVVESISEGEEGRVRIKLHSKLGALSKIADHLGMFRDNQGGSDEPANRIPPPIEVYHEDAGADEETRRQYAPAPGADK